MAVLGGVVLLSSLALVVALHAASQHVWATIVLAVIALAIVVYRSPRLYAWRYVLPGAIAVAMFVVVPIVYSFGISFTPGSAGRYTINGSYAGTAAYGPSTATCANAAQKRARGAST